LFLIIFKSYVNIAKIIEYFYSIQEILKLLFYLNVEQIIGQICYFHWTSNDMGTVFRHWRKITHLITCNLFVLSVAVVRTRTVLSLVREMTSTKILTVCKTKYWNFLRC
jgi:hypothetical protein